MTIIISGEKEVREELDKGFNEIYELLDMQFNAMPITCIKDGNTITVNSTDEFGLYCIKFLFSIFRISMNKGKTSAQKMESLAHKFKQGALPMLFNRELTYDLSGIKDLFTLDIEEEAG